MKDETIPPDPQRREFLKKSSAVAMGAATVLVPLAAGVAVLVDPLKRKSVASSGPVFVTSLDSVPKDGVPRKFSIVASRVDAWNKFPNAPIGAVYLRRSGEKNVEALNVVCPHAGCFIDFRSNEKDFFCPCHNSSFSINGKISDPKSPSPRAMDTLEVEVRNDSEVWVKFQNFQTGHSEKIPVA